MNPIRQAGCIRNPFRLAPLRHRRRRRRRSPHVGLGGGFGDLLGDLLGDLEHAEEDGDAPRLMREVIMMREAINDPDGQSRGGRRCSPPARCAPSRQWRRNQATIRGLIRAHQSSSEMRKEAIRAQQSSVARLHDERLRVRGGGELQQKVEARWLRFSVAVRKDSHHERHCAELHDDRFVTRDHRHVPECACGMGLCAATPKHHHQRR